MTSYWYLLHAILGYELYLGAQILVLQFMYELLSTGSVACALCHPQGLAEHPTQVLGSHSLTQ